MSTAEIIWKAIEVARKLVTAIWAIWDQRETLTPDEARERVRAAMDFADRQMLADEQDLLDRIK